MRVNALVTPFTLHGCRSRHRRRADDGDHEDDGVVGGGACGLRRRKVEEAVLDNHSNHRVGRD